MYILNLYIVCILCVYANLPRNAIVRLPHPRSRDSQGQEKFLALVQIRNYDTEC